MPLNPADSAFVEKLSGRLPKGTLRSAEPRYLIEPRGRWQGRAGVVAVPTSPQEVSLILAACNEARVPVVTFGGGTGLVGGQVSSNGPAPVVLSLERMNTILDVDPLENVMVAQAGTILANLHEAAEQVNRLFPLSIASSGTAQIGGNLATNAGGSNVLRYGNTRDLCLGLEVVFPDGQIWDGLTRLRKDNTGYDIRNLMIGSEGTLGVITAASLKLFPRPESYASALFVVPDPSAALELLGLVRDIAGDTVSAFELLHHNGYNFLADTMPEIRLPFEDIPQWSVLMELGLPRGVSLDQGLEDIFAQAYDQGLVSDGLLASSLAQRQAFWTVRESIPIANRRVGAIASHDISLPLRRLPGFIDQATKALSEIGDMRLNCFGHLGDGNLHFNVFPAKGKSREDYAQLKERITDLVHGMVVEQHGSVSAEHGVGRLKTKDLKEIANPVRYGLMTELKSQIDPNGIMNPGVIFPKSQD